MAFGAVLTLWGMKLEADGWRRSKYDLDKVLAIVRGFRFFVLGLAVAGFGVAPSMATRIVVGHRWRRDAGDVHCDLCADARETARSDADAACRLQHLNRSGQNEGLGEV